MANLIEIINEHSGPPVDIESIIRDLGILLDSSARLPTDISGQLELLPTGEYRISAASGDHPFRRRFTLAHELAHFLFHAHLIGSGVDDDKAYRSTEIGNYHNKNIGMREESEANRFAASILMPSDLIKDRWNDLRDVKAMAKLFMVSSQAMEIRLKGLGLIPRN